MKTPIQELIELITLMKNKEDGRVFLMPCITIAKLEAMLEKEKESLSTAFHTDRPLISCYEDRTAFDDWYNETFNNEQP